VRVPRDLLHALPEAIDAIQGREGRLLDWARTADTEPPDLAALDRLIGAAP